MQILNTRQKQIVIKLVVDENGIKETWKRHRERLMNEENEWDHECFAIWSKGWQFLSV